MNRYDPVSDSAHLDSSLGRDPALGPDPYQPADPVQIRQFQERALHDTYENWGRAASRLHTGRDVFSHDSRRRRQSLRVSFDEWLGCPVGRGSGTTTIQNAGTVVGMPAILNLSDGPRLLLATSDTGTAITIQSTLDTAVAATRASEQAGTAFSSATTYTCALSPTLTQYTAGMVLHWTPDISNTGGSITLNIDSLGATPVKLQDGMTDPAPLDLVSGRMQEIWFDGAAFRLLKPANPSGILGEIQPSCSGSVRGRLWFVAGGMGVKDSLAVCAKDAADALAWRTLY